MKLDPLALLTAVSALKDGASEAMHRTASGAIGFALQAVCGLVATGFLTTASFLWLAETRSTIAAFAIMAAVYAVLGIVVRFWVVRIRNRRHRPTTPKFAAVFAQDRSSVSARQGFPGGIGSVALLVAAGYLMGRSLMSRR